MTAVSLQPIENLLGLVIDGINDGVQVIKSGQPPVLQLGVFTNLITDIIPVLTSASQIPSSLQGFSEADAQALVAFVMGRLKVGSASAESVVSSALQAAQSIYSLVLAIKSAV